MGEFLSPRRGFIAGLAALVAAPAIIRASNLMPIKVDRWASMSDADILALLERRIEDAQATMIRTLQRSLYGDMQAPSAQPQGLAGFIRDQNFAIKEYAAATGFGHRMVPPDAYPYVLLNV